MRTDGREGARSSTGTVQMAHALSSPVPAMSPPVTLPVTRAFALRRLCHRRVSSVSMADVDVESSKCLVTVGRSSRRPLFRANSAHMLPAVRLIPEPNGDQRPSTGSMFIAITRANVVRTYFPSRSTNTYRAPNSAGRPLFLRT